MITIAMFFIMSALILYSVAILRERKIREIKLWILITFSLGFLCDLTGTSLMFLSATNKFSVSLHSVAGYFALTIMLIHLIWAFQSRKRSKKAQGRFTKYSIYAWVVWLLAFISGTPLFN